MTRLYGWGPKDERLVECDAARPMEHDHLRRRPARERRRRPLVLDGAMTGEALRAYVEQMLVPELKPGDVVVMDNLAAGGGQARPNDNVIAAAMIGGAVMARALKGADKRRSDRLLAAARELLPLLANGSGAA